MLSALELNGFKSFAERTRFEFPAGITVVVGPNGSGKSNVVDAIKWVLGAQSVKALRGKEMTDVIFSGSRTRRASNAAEASLILDNSAGLLDHDAQEIIARTSHQIAFEHLRPARDGFGEAVERLLALALEFDRDEHADRKADDALVEHRDITRDHARLLQ